MKQIVILFFVILLALVFYFRIEQSSETHLKIGVQKVLSTSKERGKFFISPNGSGKECTQSNPCGLESLDLTKGFLKNRIKSGDVIFFRGGIYHLSTNTKRVYLLGGSKDKPVIYESYPKEIAIFDGSNFSTKDTPEENWREGRFQLREDYTIVRNIEVRNMPQQGIRIFGNHNIIEGCKVYNNHLSGIDIANLNGISADKKILGSYNIIRDNIIMNNSDVGLNHHNYKEGDNADGITVSSGIGNIISHNRVYSNSDDGIDTWKSIDTLVEYNRVYQNGKGSNGNGNGIKLGGAGKNSPLGSNAVAKHNLSYSNRYIGININSGKNVLMEYNTVYNNKSFGFTLEDDTILKNNISFENKKGDAGWSKGKENINNSWELKSKLTKSEFLSLDDTSSDFLIPITGSPFESIGAYAPEKNENN